jgi:hypothetical protein
MKRFLPVLFALLIPATMFAQGRKADENNLLKSFGLDDSQVTQVMAIQKATRETVRTDFTHARLVQAQIAEALLPANPDKGAIDSLIERKGQLRTDIEKTIMSARLQVVKIIGADNFPKYARFVMGSMHKRFRQRGLMRNDPMQMGFMGPVGGLEFRPMPGDSAPAQQ